MSKFTSLVRVRDKFPPVTVPDESLFLFGVSPFNCSNSEQVPSNDVRCSSEHGSRSVGIKCRFHCVDCVSRLME